MSGIDKLLNLLDKDIPDCKKRLHDSYVNLENVATYCEGNYAKAMDKKHALDETKNYMTQSLASVAYQINLMSTNFLQLLDLQVEQVCEMESSISHLSQVVSVHKEKVARREIGELTSSKGYYRPPGLKSNGVVLPDKPEQPATYVRRPIDFNALDNTGTSKKGNLSPVQRKPSVAKQDIPTLPSNAPLQRSSLSKSGGTARRLEAKPSDSVLTSPLPDPPPPPTPPPEISSSMSRLPPSEIFKMGPESPGLPPPPAIDDDDLCQELPVPPASLATADIVAEPFASRLSRMILDEASWIPSDFVEKVVAVYSYTQDKGDELTFDEGAIIYVTKKNEDGWWEGVMDGQTGLFPNNYVEPCI